MAYGKQRTGSIGKKKPGKRKIRTPAMGMRAGGGLKGALTGRSGLKGCLMGGTKARKGKPTKRTMKPKPKPARKYRLRGEKATLKKRRGY